MMSLSKEGGERIKSRRWTVEEDERLMKAVIKYRERDWDTIQKNSGLDRSIRACRDRWTICIKPGLIKSKFTKQEEDKMINLSSIKFKGNKWTQIAKELPGRSAYDVEAFCKSLKFVARLASRTQHLVDDSQAAHNPDTTGNASMFGQGSGPSHQFPDMDGKSSTMFAPGLVSSQLPDHGSKFAQGLGSSRFSDPDSKFGQGLGSSQFPDLESTFAQGSGSSQFPAVFPSPVMLQHNGLDSTFSSTPAAGPALIDQYTSMNAGLPLLTGGTETHLGSNSSSMLKRSISSLDKPCSPRDNGNSESIFYPAEVSEDSSDDSLLPLNTDLDEQLDLSISEEDLNRLRKIIREMIEALSEIVEPFIKK